MNTALRETDPLTNAVITEAVQLIEQAGPLDDAAAMREALAQHADVGVTDLESQQTTAPRHAL